MGIYQNNPMANTVAHGVNQSFERTLKNAKRVLNPRKPLKLPL